MSRYTRRGETRVEQHKRRDAEDGSNGTKAEDKRERETQKQSRKNSDTNRDKTTTANKTNKIVDSVTNR